MKHALPALRMLIFMTLLTGIIYPVLVTGLSKVFFFEKATGSLIKFRGNVIGSELIGQKFESDRYFWSRPSAVDYNPLPSGGSNLGLASQDLKKIIDERSAKLMNKHPQSGNPPQDLIFASGSGLDPHISVAAAYFQVARIAQMRGLGNSAVRKVVNELTEPRQFGIFGEPRINVLKLNLAMDKLE